MEQDNPRANYIINFYNFINNINLSHKFMQLLQSHPCAYMLNYNQLFTDEAKKVFMFLEFTRDRDPCNKLAEILTESGQSGAAQQLREYNRSEQPMPYQDQINLDVNRAIILRSATTRWYKMDSNPRGRAVIFVQDIKYTNEPIVVNLDNEGLRFKHIFDQLGYDTQIHMRKSCTEIMSILIEYATSEHPGDSFIMMFTGHGFNGNICGNDNYEHDVLPIQNVLDLFSEKNCLALQSKPKVFLFNCCRESM
ncbi:unnamed protein product [Oppiella nova]|uniref:Caspase family p20 domain-containing protein n=1 Tax=Oppiella nova TaxID=334625 RepID=A0A7R9QWX0_9ACAR|nr:unnamed protein product [Oppiella nova]CAG2176996.1 unnamed protein product [Oppiella nova]